MILAELVHDPLYPPVPRSSFGSGPVYPKRETSTCFQPHAGWKGVVERATR